MSEEHWANNFEHASINDGNREAFSKSMAKFPTMQDAVIDGYGLQKLKGQPFKMPESLDKLPDDATRTDFINQVNKLTGREIVSDVKGLDDLDVKLNLAENHTVNDDMVSAFKEFVVSEKIPKAMAQKLIGFNNDMVSKLTAKMMEKQEADSLALAETTNKQLIEKYGSKEEVDKQSELFKRAVISKVGDNEKAEAIADKMVKAGMTTDADLAGLLLDVFSPLAAEASHEGSQGKNNSTQYKDPDEGSPSYKALGWS